MCGFEVVVLEGEVVDPLTALEDEMKANRRAVWTNIMNRTDRAERIY